MKLKSLLIALAVVTMSSTIHADSCGQLCLPTPTWIATEQAVEITANTQVYDWAFLGSTDFNLEETFQRCRAGFPECGGPPDLFVGSSQVFSKSPGDALLGDPLAFSDFVINFNTPRIGCSSSDTPPCVLGVVNVYKATVTPTIIPEGFGSITLLDSFPLPTPTPEPGTLLLFGSGIGAL